MTTETIFPQQMPLVSLKETVIFPESIKSVYINESLGKRAVQKAAQQNKLIFLSCLQEPEIKSQKVYRTGCVSFIRRMRVLEDGKIKVLVQGLRRAVIDRFEGEDVCLSYSAGGDRKRGLSETDRLELKEIKEALKQMSGLKKVFSRERCRILDSAGDPGKFCDLLLDNMELKSSVLQKVLETENLSDRLKVTGKIIKDEMEIFKLEGRLEKIIKENTRSFPSYPASPPAAVPALGFRKEEVAEFRQKFEKKALPSPARKEALKQIARLEKMHAESSEASMVRNYLDWLTELPWMDSSEDNLDLKKAKRVLDEDHFELKKAKERILEFLAVCRLRPKALKGPILCFAGPPGVGKTSLGKSIARSMGRTYHRISLGGIRDEAEIRGHRRTYVGAMPGKIIQALKTCGTKNPVIVLDEMDKMCSDFRGDPSAALLEVLDPEQNHSFRDHYLNLDFDLSSVFFIATANIAHRIPEALKDRMEIISISGYTAEEKKQIARRHLISRELRKSGLPTKHIDFTEEALDSLIHSYTREAGLRNLSRELASVCRKAAKRFVLGEKKRLLLDKKQLERMLGSPCFYAEGRLQKPSVGIATGLAWTPAGGQLLHIEAIKNKSKRGGLILTGNLKEVMKESARASLSYVRSYVKSKPFKPGIEEDWFDTHEIHIHLPDGSAPKDGPSAGVALASALLSLVTNIPLKNTVAMTGEITLSGRVLPVGGIKEKALAAFNNGISTVLLPEKNKKDLEEIPKEIRRFMGFILVSSLSEVFSEILMSELAEKQVQEIEEAVFPAGAA